MKKSLILTGAAVVAVGVVALYYQSKYRKNKDTKDDTDGSDKDADKIVSNAFVHSKYSVPQSTNRPRVRGRLAHVPQSANHPYLAKGEPAPLADPYGCDAYLQSCTPGDVGGCEYMRHSCKGYARLSTSQPGECEQLRKRCAAGDYTSCHKYSESCQYENNY